MASSRIAVKGYNPLAWRQHTSSLFGFIKLKFPSYNVRSVSDGADENNSNGNIGSDTSASDGAQLHDPQDHTNNSINNLLSSGSQSKKYLSKKTQYFEKVWMDNNPSSDSLVHKTWQPTRETSKLRKGFGAPSDKDVFGLLNTEETLSLKKYPEVKDLRDPNDRIDNVLPEDVEKKIDGRLKVPLTTYGRIGKSAFYYTRKMSILGRQGKVEEAVSMFEDVMLLRDRVMPRRRTFITLLGILGRAGHTDKAFQIFSQMKQLNLDPEARCYTSLFNACANCYDKTHGLRRARSLLQLMGEQDVEAALPTLKAAMKAFALCGDLPAAFSLVDDAAGRRLRLDAECINHLLMACASDRQAGFRRAIQVWLKMNELSIQPEASTINLLLRVARDCGMGKPKDFLSALGISPGDLNEQLLASVAEVSQTSPNKSTRLGGQLKGANRRLVQVDGDGDSRGKEMQSNRQLSHEVDTRRVCEWWEENGRQTVKSLPASDLPVSMSQHSRSPPSVYRKLLTRNLTHDDLEKSLVLTTRSVTDFDTPVGRLVLLGGAQRLLALMDQTGRRPDMRTYSQLLACLPNTEAAEVWLLTEIEGRKLTPDVDFFNDIMARRVRRDIHSVKAVLPVMSALRLTPNMRTYAAVACTCTTHSLALELIQDMESANVEPTIMVMRHLIGASGMKFSYKLKLLKIMEDMGHCPTPEIIAKIEKDIALAKEKIVEAEKNDPSSIFLADSFRIPLRNFQRFYEQWMMRTKLDVPVDPWRQKRNEDKDKLTTSVSG